MADEELSDRRQQILDYITEAVQDRGYPPTVREIGDAVGLKSSSTVHFHLKALERMGLIERDPNLTRAIRPRTEGAAGAESAASGVRYAPIVGRVAAGQPIFAAENIEDTLTLPEDLFPHDELFLLEVKGDSMIDAGILNGDLLVVQRQQTAENGDIVVALLDDEATVKRFFRHDDNVELRPENEQMEPIYVREATIVGRVRGVVRSL